MEAPRPNPWLAELLVLAGGGLLLYGVLFVWVKIQEKIKTRRENPHDRSRR